MFAPSGYAKDRTTYEANWRTLSGLVHPSSGVQTGQMGCRRTQGIDAAFDALTHKLSTCFSNGTPTCPATPRFSASVTSPGRILEASRRCLGRLHRSGSVLTPQRRRSVAPKLVAERARPTRRCALHGVLHASGAHSPLGNARIANDRSTCA